MAFVPQFAPIVVLIFLGSILSGMLAAAVFVYGVARKQPAVRWAAIAIATIPAGYATLLFGASLTSQERVLTPWFDESTISPRSPLPNPLDKTPLFFDIKHG